MNLRSNEWFLCTGGLWQSKVVEKFLIGLLEISVVKKVNVGLI
jgi:hypothetical protein